MKSLRLQNTFDNESETSWEILEVTEICLSITNVELIERISIVRLYLNFFVKSKTAFTLEC